MAALFAKFDLDMPDHAKIAPLSDAAFRAWVESILWSRKHLTDGFLARRYVAARWSLEVARELVESDDVNPLWIEVEGGYQIRDFDQHQDTKAVVEARSANAKRAGQKGGRSKALATAKRNPSNRLAETETETETEKKKKLAAREDVAAILDHLDSGLQELGVRLPSRGITNLDEARKLIDVDGKTVDQVKRAIDFALADDFWSQNIHSPKALRKSYDKLAIKARNEAAKNPEPEQPRYRMVSELPA